MFTVSKRARLSKNFKINEAHRHEAKREARHQPGKQNQECDYEDSNKEICVAAPIVYCH